MTQTIEESAQMMHNTPTYETLAKVIKIHVSPYRLTDRGIKYCKDLTSKYLQGLKINDDKIAVLLGLHTYGTNMDQLGQDTNGEMMDEIKERWDIGSNAFIDTILEYLLRGGFLETNPHQDLKFSKELIGQYNTYMREHGRDDDVIEGYD